MPDDMPEEGRVQLIHFPEETRETVSEEPALMTASPLLMRENRLMAADGLLNARENGAEEETVVAETVKSYVENGTVFFTADGFSVYGLASYTVDFAYDVDGQIFTYSIAGGSCVGLSELLPVLGAAEDDPETEEDEAALFHRLRKQYQREIQRRFRDPLRGQNRGKGRDGLYGRHHRRGKSRQIAVYSQSSPCLKTLRRPYPQPFFTGIIPYRPEAYQGRRAARELDNPRRSML